MISTQNPEPVLAKTKFHVVDAIMGSGKSQGAIAYINAHPKWKFIIVTPYLAEIERFINGCPKHRFKEPLNDEEKKNNTKTGSLNQLLDCKSNIVMTHKLFMIQEQKIEEKYAGYHLIIDESPENPISEIEDIMPLEADFLLNKCISLEENGNAVWTAPFIPRYSDIKELCDKGRLRGYVAESEDKTAKGIFEVFPPSTFNAFEEVILLTYLFKGQIFKGYLDMVGIEYDYWHVEHPGKMKYCLTSTPQPLQKFEYKKLIRVCGSDSKEKINEIGKSYYSLSKSWYECAEDGRLNELSANLYNYFHNYVNAKSNERLWTSFKSYKNVIADRGHFAKSFLACNTRATNEFRERTKLAYLANRFMVPSYSILFTRNNIIIDNRLFALQEMLQWIWRSAIRDGKPIEIYVPSERMRNLLMQWLDYVSGEIDYLFESDEAVLPCGDVASEK